VSKSVSIQHEGSPKILRLLVAPMMMVPIASYSSPRQLHVPSTKSHAPTVTSDRTPTPTVPMSVCVASSRQQHMLNSLFRDVHARKHQIHTLSKEEGRSIPSRATMRNHQWPLIGTADLQPTHTSPSPPLLSVALRWRAQPRLSRQRRPSIPTQYMPVTRCSGRAPITAHQVQIGQTQ
jgi:hypothetical protein